MAEKLTPQQQQAVDDRGGKLLVSAAAGSGKTKVLVDRLMKYILDPVDPANIDDFLMITYTKAAASELRGKIAAKLSEHLAVDPENRHLQRQLQRLYLAKISTVHSFCSDILREYAYGLDLPGDFRVAEENACAQLQERAMEEILEAAYGRISEDADFRAFADTQGLGRNDRMVPELVLKVYNSARCHLHPEGWLESCLKNADLDGIADISETPWGAYLMEDLAVFLDAQIAAMERCVEAVSRLDGQEKPLNLLRNNVLSLQRLRQCATWDAIIANSNVEFGNMTFKRSTNDPAVTEPVKAVRKACKESLAKKLRRFNDSTAQIVEDMRQIRAASRGLLGLVKEFEKAYGQKKRSRRMLDFSDLEHQMLNLLLGKTRTGTTAVARELGRRFREILVDEYQDSNEVQDAIFAALTEKRQNLFMVGDVKQSIYQFRLADPGIFLEKYSAYVPAGEAEAGQGRKVLLSSNFRSGGGVIAAVNDVFSDCMSPRVGGLFYTDAEMLREGISHEPLDEPEVELHCIDVAEDTYAEEASFVAERICQLLDGKHHVRGKEGLRPITEDDIVILLRSPGSVGSCYQAALESRGIRCTSGGGVDLLLTEEIGTLRSILQIISNPRQDIPLLAAMASPVFGFSSDELAAIRGNDKRGCFYDALTRSDSGKAKALVALIDSLRRMAGLLPVSELIGQIIFHTRLDNVYGAKEGGPVYKANIQVFCQLAADFDSNGMGDLDRFLEHLEALSQRGLVVTPEQASGGAVTLMSIHKSKGLEFPVVFLCGLSRRFNRESQQAQILCDKDLGLGMNCVDTPNRIRYPSVAKNSIAVKIGADSISEEMRVLYVAMTRARDRLIMTYASDSLQKDLEDLAGRMDLSGKELITAQVSNPGKWILYSALRRMEAGALFALGGRPAELFLREPVWRITVQEGKAAELSAEQEKSCSGRQLTAAELEKLRRNLTFSYPHADAVKAPSKQTATQRKGREKDREAAENAHEPKPIHRTWRKPSFLTAGAEGRERGNAMHSAMQHICFAACADLDAVRAEVERLVRQKLLTEEQGSMVDPAAIAAFFQTEIGQQLRAAEDVQREFKFSILDDADAYVPGLRNEQVLLQGVVDCAMIEPDGITILDFKSDRGGGKDPEMLAQRYRLQVETYAQALSRIFALPVKAKGLYFFHPGKLIWL